MKTIYDTLVEYRDMAEDRAIWWITTAEELQEQIDWIDRLVEFCRTGK